tara:strand:- start:300 stop:572 length:273 start_codon:yes stop_codon:yes gene_type:complete
LSLGKKDIVNNISSETFLSKQTSKFLLEKFLSIFMEGKLQKIKLTNFGTFQIHQSPQRVGRNPKTKHEFIIPKRKKLTFKPSSSVKKDLN